MSWKDGDRARLEWRGEPFSAAEVRRDLKRLLKQMLSPVQTIREVKRAVREQLEAERRLRDAMGAHVGEAKRSPEWQCHCGHPNAGHLLVCEGCRAVRQDFAARGMTDAAIDDFKRPLTADDVRAVVPQFWPTAPCPFCRSSLAHVITEDGHHVECRTCYARGPSCDSPGEAVDFWNGSIEKCDKERQGEPMKPDKPNKTQPTHTPGSQSTEQKTGKPDKARLKEQRQREKERK